MKPLTDRSEHAAQELGPMIVLIQTHGPIGFTSSSMFPCCSMTPADPTMVHPWTASPGNNLLSANLPSAADRPYRVSVQVEININVNGDRNWQAIFPRWLEPPAFHRFNCFFVHSRSEWPQYLHLRDTPIDPPPQPRGRSSPPSSSQSAVFWAALPSGYLTAQDLA
jgi:hypothetical protein